VKLLCCGVFVPAGHALQPIQSQLSMMRKNLQQFFPFCFRLFDCCLLLPVSLLGHLAVEESSLQLPLHRLQVLESVQTPDPALMIPPPTSPQEGQSAAQKTLQARKTIYQAEDSSGNTSRRSWSCTDCIQRLSKDRDRDRQKQRQRTWAVRLDANRASTRASICVSSPTTDLTIFLPFCSSPHLLLLLCEKALFSCSHKPTRMLTASGCYVLHLCFYSRKNNSPRAVHICCTSAHLRHHHPIKSSSTNTLKHNSPVHHNLRQISLSLCNKTHICKMLDSSQTIF
jgi:hypothetical protein